MKLVFKSIKKIIILVLILLIPGFLYYLLTVGGKNRYKPLLKFGPKALTGTFHKVRGKAIADTNYHHIASFLFTDQNGQQVSLAKLKGKVLVIGLFYTNCPSVCGQLNYYMASVAKAYLSNKMVNFISITVDPARDTPAALKAYADQYGVPASKWQLVTADTATVYGFARQSLLLNAAKLPNGDFVYSDKLVLVDGHGIIRGYYSGTVDSEVARLNDEIKVQVMEELLNIKAPEM